jgi:hypothetical protein
MQCNAIKLQTNHKLQTSNFKLHEEEHLEDDPAVCGEHPDGSHHGAGHDELYGLRTVLRNEGRLPLAKKENE